MALQGKIVVSVVNDTVGAANPSLIDFDIEAGVDLGMAAARCIAYVIKGGEAYMAVGTRVTGARFRAEGAAGSTDIPFPVVEYALNRTAFAGIIAIAQDVAYGRTLGGGGLSPIGTSICVSENTALVGRAGRGRHFLPFISSSAVDAAGQYKGALLDVLQLTAEQLLGIEGTSPASDLNLCVKGVADRTYKRVLSVKVRPIFSNLSSRRK